MSRQLKLKRLHNTRDLGGMTAAGGKKIREGRLLRSGQLYGAADEDLAALSQMTELVIDFRTESERNSKPDPLLPGAENLHMPILESLKPGITREKESDEQVIMKLMKDADQSLLYMCRNYIQFVESPEAQKHYASFVRLLLKDREKAVLWHCTAGKDRAGFGSVIVQSLLGVQAEDILEDYLMTNEYLKPETEKMRGMIRMLMGKSRFGEELDKAFGYLFGAHKEFLDAAYSRAQELFGSFDGYLSKGLGITQDERERLQDLYLV